MNKQPKDRGERNDIARSVRDVRKIIRGPDSRTDDDETNIADLLADIRHFCHTADIDYYECADRAYNYYRDERNLPVFNPEREAA